MIVLKRILSQLHRYVLWALVSLFVWGFVFYAVTDTKKEKKVTVYANVASIRSDELEEELEKSRPEGIRMIKVHHFSYDMFGNDVLASGDVFIISGSEIEKYKDSLCPVEADGENCLVIDGEAYGYLIWDAEKQQGHATGFICYTFENAEGSGENYYICFNKDSLHLGDLNGSKDDAALVVAKLLLALD